MSNEVYLNCGIYNNPEWDPFEGCYINNELLFIAKPGYFASTAWCESDEAYNDITGRKFEGMTSDDGKLWMLERSKIRRLAENDNINALLEKSCDEFKRIWNERFS